MKVCLGKLLIVFLLFLYYGELKTTSIFNFDGSNVKLICTDGTKIFAKIGKKDAFEMLKAENRERYFIQKVLGCTVEPE